MAIQKMGTKDAVVQIRMRPEVKGAVEVRAARLGLTVTAYVTMVLLLDLDRHSAGLGERILAPAAA